MHLDVIVWSFIGFLVVIIPLLGISKVRAMVRASQEKEKREMFVTIFEFIPDDFHEDRDKALIDGELRERANRFKDACAHQEQMRRKHKYLEASGEELADADEVVSITKAEFWTAYGLAEHFGFELKPHIGDYQSEPV